MIPTRARLAVRCAVALGWLTLLALVTLVTTTGFAADTRPLCDTYVTDGPFCVPKNGAQLSKCKDWNGEAKKAKCVSDGKDIVQKQPKVCGAMVNYGVGYWKNACVHAKNKEGEAILEICSDQYHCVSVNRGTPLDPKWECERGDEVTPPDRTNAVTDTDDCILPAPIIDWDW
jgi:hypothetical protein